MKRPPEFYLGKPADGCALFVKRSKLRFGAHTAKRFADLTGDDSMTQVVIAAQVVDAASEKHLFTISTSHLKAGGRAGAFSEVRSAQADAWVKFLQEFGSQPYVLTGDM